MSVKSNNREKVTLELTKGEVTSLKGTKLDDAQYIALVLKGEAERGKGRVVLGSIQVEGRRYHIAVVGQPAITDHKGVTISNRAILATALEENKVEELNFDALAYLELTGKLPDGRDYYGAYYSIADLEKHASECAANGEL